MAKWKDIQGYEGRYQVSDNGEIMNVKTKRLLKQTPRPKGYLAVTLYKGSKESRKSFLVHRLVADAFIGKSSLQVNHKDFNKTNNNANNLEYCTNQENMTHAVKGGRYDEDNKRRRRPILQIHPLTGEIVKEWSSMLEAKMAGYSSIDNVFYSKGKSAQGYYWRDK